jgi:hypothetical protein
VDKLEQKFANKSPYYVQIQMNVIKFSGLLIIIVIFVTSNTKRLPMEDDDHLELSGINARLCLQMHDERSFDKRINNLVCVLCKFNLVQCCKPNICV